MYINSPGLIAMKEITTGIGITSRAKPPKGAPITPPIARLNQHND